MQLCLVAFKSKVLPKVLNSVSFEKVKHDANAELNMSIFIHLKIAK